MQASLVEQVYNRRCHLVGTQLPFIRNPIASYIVMSLGKLKCLIPTLAFVAYIAGLAGFVVVADGFIPPMQYGEKVLPRTFQHGRVVYGIPYSGGDMGSCAVEPGSEDVYPLGSGVLIFRTRIFGRCSLSVLPESWAPAKFD